MIEEDELTDIEDARVSQGRSNMMGWRGIRGESWRYHGPLVDLGFGIAGRRRNFGPRSFVWHVAFGYVSGFPVHHVLHYALLHSFFPRAVERSAQKVRDGVAAGTHEPKVWRSK